MRLFSLVGAGLLGATPAVAGAPVIITPPPVELRVQPAGPKRPPDVLVVSDAFGDVPDEFRPSAGKPVYYVVMAKAERDIGAPIVGAPRLGPDKIESAVVDVLARQGFIQTKVGGPMPAIALVIAWGSAKLDSIDIPQDPPAQGPPPPPINLLFNGLELAMLTGAGKAKFVMDEAVVAQLNEAADGIRTYVFVGALDLPSLLQKKTKLLWRTRMSVEATHNTLPESLELMLASAAPYFGREVAVPMIMDETARRKAQVILGTPVVVPDGPTSERPNKP